MRKEDSVKRISLMQKLKESSSAVKSLLVLYRQAKLSDQCEALDKALETAAQELNKDASPNSPAWPAQINTQQ